MIRMTIPGVPVAKQRHRTANGRTYNPQSEIERAVQWEMRRLLGNFKPTDRPLILTLHAYFPRPKKHYGTGKNSDKLKPSSPKFYTSKPDHDNLVKFYMDCMNKLVFMDDCQVIGTGGLKFWIDKKAPGFVVIELEEATVNHISNPLLIVGDF